MPSGRSRRARGRRRHRQDPARGSARRGQESNGGAGAGAAVEILLQMDAVVLLANTAHPLDPRPEFTGTAVDVVAWHAPEDLRLLEEGTLAGPLSPEHRQALNNTEHDLTARNAR